MKQVFIALLCMFIMLKCHAQLTIQMGAGLYLQKGATISADGNYTLKLNSNNVISHEDKNYFIETDSYGKVINRMSLNISSYIIQSVTQRSMNRNEDLSLHWPVRNNEILTTNKGNLFPQISILPNPVKNNAILRVDADESSKALVSITDATGKIVYRSTLSLNRGINQHNLPFSRFAKGYYNVHIESPVINNSLKLIRH